MKGSRRGIQAGFFATFLLTARVAAQSAPARAALDVYFDSLVSVASVDQLKTIEQRARRPVPEGAAIATLRLGLSVLRQAEVGDGREFDRARDIFRQAHALEPEWPYPLLLIGVAEHGKGDWLAAEPLNLGTRIGHGAYRSAIRALIEATGKDPGLTAAILEMDRVATALRDTAMESLVLEAIRKAVEAGNHDPPALLVLGRRERSAGRSTAAIPALEGYLASGTNTALARFEIARTLLTEGRDDGDSLYFAAAATVDSTTIAELRADLVPIAEPAELARFDSLPGNERSHYLQQFWNDRARRDLRSPGERLREHYRRLRFARRHFVLSNNRRYYSPRDLYRAARSETLDDRGIVYVRHGEPDTRLTPLLFGLRPNETWLYRRADGDLLMHFSGGGDGFEGGDLTDYRLVPSVFALRGDRTPKDMLIASRFEVSDIYQKIMSWGPHGAGRMMREEQKWGERSAEIGTATDAFALGFPQRLEGMTDLVTIGRQGGTPLLQVIYALPGIDEGASIRFRISLFDSAGSVRAWLDTVATSRAIGTGGSGGRFQLPAPPGKSYYRLALEAGEAGMVTPRDSIVVPDLHGPTLSISGIGLGRGGSHVIWVTSPTDTAQLSPSHEFERNSELQLYFEVYGLEARTPFIASIQLLEKKRGARIGRRRLQFTFQEEGQGVVTRIRRAIRLAGLDPGEYWLEARIQDAGGRQVTTRKRLRVLPVAQ